MLAERVVLAEVALYAEAWSARSLDEELLLELHGRISGDLVPEWAGRWRTVGVQVGRWEPVAPHLIAGEMRNYAADLAARWPAASETVSDLTLELLAFAEGQFLSVHPFRDFNGRVARLFLLELLRRLDLPRVPLAPQDPAGRARYFTALEAADRRDWRPLVEIWRDRFSAA